MEKAGLRLPVTQNIRTIEPKSVKVLVENRTHSTGYSEEGLIKGLFTKRWAEFRETNKEYGGMQS